MKLSEKDFMDKFNDLYKKNEQNRPYNMNILDELHANENAHTRILIKLLCFAVNGKYPIFEKFIDILNRELDHDFQIFQFYKPVIKGQYADIDAYIYSEDKSISIIIENKIQWAKDQDKQLERYIKSSQYQGIEKEKIYAIYLTDDGRKKISDYSLTGDAKKALGMEEGKNGRFIELNYKDHLLPFLKDILSYLDFSKEIYLKSAIVQYIDYLEGRFGFREREKVYMKTMTEGLRSLLSIKDEDIKTISQKETVINNIQSFWESIKIESSNSIQKKDIVPYINALCESIYPLDMHPQIVARNVLFKFADKEKHILDYYKSIIPFDEAEIFWRNQNLLTSVYFRIKKKNTLIIKFTSQEIEFNILDEKNKISQFFESYNKMNFQISSNYSWKISYEENYKTIINSLEELFIEMKKVSSCNLTIINKVSSKSA